MKLVANIEPVQDLHGYEAPWPAGGGKNKLNAVNLTPTDSGRYLNTSGAILKSGVQYTFSMTSSAQTNNRIYLGYSSSDATITQATNINSLNPYELVRFVSGSTSVSATFTPSVDAYYYLWVGDTVGSLTFSKAQIESGATATSYAPFENLCPISGWTGCEVEQANVNLLSNAVNSTTTYGVTFTVNADKSITISTQDTATFRANIFYSGELHLPPANYYLSIGKSFASGQCYFELYIYRSATGTGQYINTNGVSGVAFTLNDGDYIRQMYFSVFAGKSVNDTIYPQISVGSTASSYSAYTGSTTAITWQDEAGTVYGGNLDVTTGVLTATYGIATLNGSASENWVLWNSAGKKLFAVVPMISGDNYSYSGSVISNQFKYIGMFSAPPVRMIEGEFLFNSADTVNWNRNVSFYYPSIGEDVTTWKTYLSNNPIQVCYPLATPLTYQLTAEEITLLAGENNVWVNTGDTELTYWGSGS